MLVSYDLLDRLPHQSRICPLATPEQIVDHIAIAITSHAAPCTVTITPICNLHAHAHAYIYVHIRANAHVHLHTHVHVHVHKS